MLIVDTRFVDLSSIPDEVRYRIFDYLWEKGVGSRYSGIKPYQANKIKNQEEESYRRSLKANA